MCCYGVLNEMMDAVVLVLSWTLFVPAAHDVDVQPMPDMATCLRQARTITEKIAHLEEGGLSARLVARCVAVPMNIQA